MADLWREFAANSGHLLFATLALVGRAQATAIRPFHIGVFLVVCRANQHRVGIKGQDHGRSWCIDGSSVMNIRRVSAEGAFVRPTSI